MRFRKSGEKWEPISSDELLREGVLSGGALLLLLAVLLVALLVVASLILALFKYGHPITTPLAVLVEYRWPVGVFAASLFVVGFLHGWDTTGDKGFEALVIEKLSEIEKRIKVLENKEEK
jgi:hypothetical protein